MNFEFFESTPIAWFCVGLVITMLVFCELGYQLGQRARSHKDREASASLGPMVGGLLGMLAFVLAFTFSQASSQHDIRKSNVLEEANAIGTAYLRADLLDNQDGTEVKGLLREYVDIRLEAATDSEIDIATALEQSVEIQNRLWALGSSAALENPSTNTSLVVQSINEVIDMHERRVTGALRYRIPMSVWIALVAITALTMIVMGTQAGLAGKRRLVAVFPLTLAFAVLVTLVVDLNRPQNGLLTVGQHSLIELQKSMARDAE